MHAGENLHRRIARIVPNKLLVNFKNAFQLPVKNLAIDVGQVEIDHRLAVDAEVMLVNDFENCASRDIARHEIPVLRIPLFEEVPALALRNRLGIALIARSLRDPHASALTARRF